MVQSGDLIRVRPTQVHLYKSTPLYYMLERTNEIVLYKEIDIVISKKRLQKNTIPTLYIHKNDRVAAIKEVQHAYNTKLREVIAQKDIGYVKKILVTMVSDFFTEPKNDLLDGVLQSIDIVLEDFTDHIHDLSAPLENLVYTTAVHCINVMCIALGYSIYHGVDPRSKRAKQIALAGLFHDIGKTLVDEAILNKPDKLSVNEFDIIKQHPENGYNILRAIGVTDEVILNAALEHHENNRGTGYPYGKSSINETSNLIGFIDKYEALTSSERAYKEQMSIYETLNMLKKDVIACHKDNTIFNDFVLYMASRTTV